MRSNLEVKDRHGECLCKENSPVFKTVTTKTREGDGLWEKCLGCGLVINRSGIEKEKKVSEQEFANMAFNSKRHIQEKDKRRHLSDSIWINKERLNIPLPLRRNDMFCMVLELMHPI